LTVTVVSVVVIACLYWAQVVFIPLALAIFLTFLLSPAVTALERRRLGRIPSVVLVVVLTALVLFGGGWIVTRQLSALVGKLPQHTENVKIKIRSLRETFKGTLSERWGRMIGEISGELETLPPGASPEQPTGPFGTQPIAPPAVVVQPDSPPWLSRLPSVIKPALQPMGSLALAVVLTIFMLLSREDLRNRFIRLVGRGHLTTATRAVDDAGARISRYLVMQLIVNGTYGLVWGIGLLLIGVDYALLWGFLAAVLRYIPFIGAPIAALLPISLSLVLFEGWLQVFLILGLLTVLELVSNNVMEPWLYGQSIGVSSVALIIAAAFWTFLWGPIGLILSGPLTVCLVVLGRHVPALKVFDVLLGDEPVLDPDVTYYQRLLASDLDEASEIATAYLKTAPGMQIYDDLLVPSLISMNRDKERDDLSEEDEKFILQATGEILEEIGERQAATPASSNEPAAAAPASEKISLLACPARDEADERALEMLRQMLDPAKWEVTLAAVELTAAELAALAAQTQPSVVCIGSLPPGGLAHARYLCKKIRSRLPEVKIFVVRLGVRAGAKQNQDLSLTAGADVVTNSLLETVDQLTSWLPVLSERGRRRSDRSDDAIRIDSQHTERRESAISPAL
jgi:predicted PurR-regulated permease PerM